MQAVVLAGGLATRLLPRTSQLPKSLIEVRGRPFVSWQLEALANSGIAEVVLCVGHLGSQIRAHVGDGSAFGVRVRYSEDGPVLLGTAGALRRACALLAPSFLVTYGDSYLPFDYSAPLRDLEAHAGALATLAVYRNAGRWDASNTRIAGEWVQRYAKESPEPDLDHIDYGAMALRREVIASLPTDRSIALSDVQQDLASAGRLRAFVATERFYEIGSEAGLTELEAYLALHVR